MTEIKQFAKYTAAWPPLIYISLFGAMIGSIVLISVPWMKIPRSSIPDLAIESWLKPKNESVKSLYNSNLMSF